MGAKRRSVSPVEPERVTVTRDRPATAGRYVLYWMQQSQRADGNPALEHAIAEANALGLPCLVAFGLMDDYPEAQARHYAFMLEGLAETKARLAARGIKLVVRRGTPWRVAAELAADASVVVCDVGYLRHQRLWRRELARAVDPRVVEVEGDVVVPVLEVSNKAEYAARTIRPKINRCRERFMVMRTARRPAASSLALPFASELELADPAAVLERLSVPREVAPTKRMRGGISPARRRLTRFLRSSLAGYAGRRNDPSAPSVSELSPYLHFGQISPVEIALKIGRAAAGSAEDKDSFLEELIVRRELAMNFVRFTDDYDRYEGLPQWARDTLAAHANDPRPYRYTRRELEEGRTHDPYWNAAMREGRATGYMHNYMRMYWGKKIIEWTDTPAAAYRTALHLNNKYFLDGRDPASYMNVGWLFGLHDRAWTERPVFGKIRYMSAAGLERKFDIEAYVDRVAALARAPA